MSHDFKRLNDEASFEPEHDDSQAEAQADHPASRLSASPEDEANLRRLNLVDRLFSSASMLAPGSDFAERVVEAIRRDIHSINNNAGLGLILGFSMITLIVSSIMTLSLAILISIIMNWSEVYQTLLWVSGEIQIVEKAVGDALQGSLTHNPIFLGLAGLALPLSAAWWWIARRIIWMEKTES